MIVPEGGGAGNNRSWNVLKQLTFAAVQKRFSWMTFWRKEGSVEYCHVTVVSSGVGQSIRHVKVVNSVGEYVIVEPLAGARRVTWGTAAPAGGADASRAAVRTPATRAARGMFSRHRTAEAFFHASFGGPRDPARQEAGTMAAVR